MEETRYCKKCGKHKPLSEWYESVHYQCRQCERKYQRRWYLNHRVLKRQSLPEGMRRCNKCGETKPVDQFYRDKSNLSGYHHYCKKCSDGIKKARKKKEQAAKEAQKQVLPEGHKQCTKCKEVLPYLAFNRVHTSSDGYRCRCRECEKEYKQTETYKAAAKAYEQRPEVRAVRNERKQEKRRTDVEYQAKEKAYRQEYQKRDYVAEKHRKWQAEYRARPENRRKACKRTREWTEANPERKREQGRIHYLRKKGADGEHTIEQWNELLTLCDGRCVVCGTTEDITRDHIEPVTWGGSDMIYNIQPMCFKHNREKNNAYAADYRPAHVRAWAWFQSFPQLESGVQSWQLARVYQEAAA